MSPVTHFLAGWVFANASTRFIRRERAIITIAAVAPDLDGLGIIPELVTRDSANPLLWYSQYHHLLGHNLPFGLIVTLLAFTFAARRSMTAALAFFAFHLHLLCDLAGSRSPDGYQWPIHYLWPFSDSWQLTWNGQWELNAWPNFVITGAALVLTFVLALKRRYSPLEIVSESANRAFVEALRRRFGTRD